jgi:hypothetical protein
MIPDFEFNMKPLHRDRFIGSYFNSYTYLVMLRLGFCENPYLFLFSVIKDEIILLPFMLIK